MQLPVQTNCWMPLYLPGISTAGHEEYSVLNRSSGYFPPGLYSGNSCLNPLIPSQNKIKPGYNTGLYCVCFPRIAPVAGNGEPRDGSRFFVQ